MVIEDEVDDFLAEVWPRRSDCVIQDGTMSGGTMQVLGTMNMRRGNSNTPVDMVAVDLTGRLKQENQF